MSHRPHPLRQSYTVDPPLVNRQSSTASSSASSGYSDASLSSNPYNPSNASTSSSVASNGNGASALGHRRGRSEAAIRHRAATFNEPSRSPETMYSMARQSLRPLPQPPTTSGSSPPPPPPRTPPRHERHHHHERGQSIDMGRLSLYEGRVSPTPSPTSLRSTNARPASMVLSRLDSVRQDTPRTVANPHHAVVHSPLIAPDLQMLGRSSTNQLRTLSRLAEDESRNEFAIISPAQEVVGLRGRRRLQRMGAADGGRNGQRSDRYGFEGRNWMDKQRQFIQAYEYLCHIGEAKEWIEDIIHCQIPPIVELEEALRDGVTLAEVVEALNPGRKYRIFRNPRLQARHWDNVANFFRYLDEVEMPDLFRFELIDLYEKKNIPKVIYCIHALSWLLFRKGIVDFRIGNLVGQLEFEHHELEATQKGLDKLGINMPSFGNMGADFGVEEAPPEPVETEEERIERELAENEESITEIQAQIRGAMLRMHLGRVMGQLWDSEDWIIDLQSRVRGEWTRQVIDYRLQMRRFAINLQSAVRGFLVRRHMMHREHFWKAKEKDIVKLQSMMRAIKARNDVQDIKSQLAQADAPVRSIQAMIRGHLARKQFHSQRQETSDLAGPVLQLQAAIRGMLARDKVDRVLGALEEQAQTVINFQAVARATLMRHQMDLQQEALRNFGPEWAAIQAASRGRLLRQNITATKFELERHSSDIGVLQAHIRAAAVRREVTETNENLRAHEQSVLDLQAFARGMLTRQRITTVLDSLDMHTAIFIDLQARARGSMSRMHYGLLLDELNNHEEEVILLQALARAMLLRCNIGGLLTELDEHEETIVELQALAQGFLVRGQFAAKKQHFNENMQKVVKIQSFVRAKLQGEAYKSLTSGKNPPVSAVKNFVHLLNDSGFDFNEEVEFERVRKTVVQQVRQNEMLEQYIDQLDIKIALLVKNKITLDEVVKHQSNYGGHTTSLLANSSISSGNQFDLKALNKSSRKKLDSYQQLFFNLQTQPQYLARLFRRLREQGTAEKECKRIEHLVMGLFGYAQKTREEYYLLKLITRSIHEEVEYCSSVQDYLRGNFFWTRLLTNYGRSPRDRRYLRELLGPLIRDNIIEDPALDLESDPMQIYRSAVNNEELRTGQPSRRPLDIPRDLAIKDPETRELFIDHLRDLREICDQFLAALEDLLPRMPYGLRFICQQIFEALCNRFKREPQHHILQLVCNWVWRFYLQPAVINPEQVGVIEKILGPLQKRNLSEVAKVLGQIASGRPFGGDNIYLQPLNAFVGESAERLVNITHGLISVANAEHTFGVDEFNDLYAKSRPTLYIKMGDIFAIHNLVAQEISSICPSRTDVIYEILQELGSAKSNENEMHAAGSSDIQMFLTPKLHDIDDPEADVKSLFMETKRCILYIIRIQTGANLLEILVRPPTEEDEEKWQALLREDFSSGSNTKGAYSDVNMVDVTRMSYYDMKRNALENIMRLEQMGRVTKHNYYQDVLNAIALDIRTKSRRRVQRQRELEGVRLTLGNLHEKAKYLEQQRKSYDDYIEQAMATLQKNQGKRHFFPFTKQYNHQRELERSGRVPKFGSYKYSVRALSGKGVIVSWQGVPERDWNSINLTIACDQVGIFNVEGSRGHIQIPGASAVIPIEDLLQAQFEARQFMEFFEGNLRVNVNLLLHLLYRKFYRTQ
ncbi:putative ras gtpase activating protein [Rosellinia necatrix]|uniref:Putative ras gtpase activating protein n=1 Tax=Rosellinia necatrix TaxID=77044 RepID=A0A1W2TC09_ROSNE|nr:putative ras gtpase activating protein [Rosellinia necatrix]